MIHNLLSGNHRVPRPETMKKISTGLQVSLVDLYRAAGVGLPAPESMGGGSAWLRVAESVVLDEEQGAWVMPRPVPPRKRLFRKLRRHPDRGGGGAGCGVR